MVTIVMRMRAMLANTRFYASEDEMWHTNTCQWWPPPPPLVMPEWPWHASPEDGAWRLPAKPYVRPMRPTTRSNP